MQRKNLIHEDQLSLPFTSSQSGGQRRTASISLDDRARFFWFIAGVSILSLFVYFYAINAIARNTALRQNLEHHVADASSRIGTLEFAYIDLKNSVTSELAYSMGFREAKAPLYVSRDASTALTLNR